MPIDIQGVAPLLQVFDLTTSVTFYRDILGFEVVNLAQDWWALLRLNGIELMLNTAYETDRRPPQPDPLRIAAHADTTLYFGCSDVDAAYQELRAKGVPLKEPVVRSYGMKQLELQDPDGYGLCLQWPA